MNKLPCIECRLPYIECINCILWHKDSWHQRHNWFYCLLWETLWGAKRLYCRICGIDKKTENETLKQYAKKFPAKRSGQGVPTGGHFAMYERSENDYNTM